jgi:hypothetical protein
MPMPAVLNILAGAVTIALGAGLVALFAWLWRSAGLMALVAWLWRSGNALWDTLAIKKNPQLER